MSELETVDLEGVEILAAGGPVHGVGSPPEGDRYSIADLEAIAQANRELESELRPPAKIGHATGGPRVGTLANLRVAGDKLIADVRNVPRRFGDLVRARAYDGRSVEMARFTSQRTGRRYDRVVSALAWLGDTLPAVRTLDDVVALYAEDRIAVVRMYEDGGESATAAAIVDDALARGAIPARARETALRMCSSAPAPFAAYIDAQPGDAVTAHANQRELGSTPEWQARDLAEREAIARDYGMALEDVL